ncbi:hypothetical protein CspeluHIS016_0703840 [Cutaneotrichosporon spelunceum]|uniref:Uncharacterized protein n=1 Tax=Cutaneotrichosporon spelunceum TaxID=1672016 RepID=A0AAD3TYU4_9TREE|nr:hypothetical protein CspeluHIS016_0703840 [Cutaneotrichosporon spelunceum]
MSVTVASPSLDRGHHSQPSITDSQGSVLHDYLGDDNGTSVAGCSEIADDEQTTTTDVPDDVTEPGRDSEDKENGPTITTTNKKEGGVNKVLKSGVFGASPKAAPPARKVIRPDASRVSLANRKPLTAPTAASAARTGNAAQVQPARPKTASSTSTGPGSPRVARARPLASATTPVAKARTGAGPTATATAARTRPAITKPASSSVPGRTTISASTAAVQKMREAREARQAAATAASSTRAPTSNPPARELPSVASNASARTAAAPAASATAAKPTARPRASLSVSTTSASARTIARHATTASSSVRPRASLASATSAATVARKVATEAEVQARIDEITKKFEEQHASLEAKIAEEKANLEVKLAEAADASAKKFGEEKEALEGKIAELAAKRDELEAKLAKVTDDYSTAQKAHEDTTNKLVEMEHTHSRTLDESTNSRSSLVAEHEAKIKELTAAHEEFENQVKALDAELSEAVSAKTSVAATLESLQADLAAKVKEQDALAAEAKKANAALEAKVAKLEILKKKLEDEIAEGAEEAEKSMAGAVSLEGKLKDLQEENAELQVDLDVERKQLSEERTAWDNERASLKSELESHLAQSMSAKELLDKSVASAETYASEIKTLKCEHSSLVDAQTTLKLSYEALVAKHKDASDTLAEHKKSEASSKEAVTKLEAQLKEAEEKVKASGAHENVTQKLREELEAAVVARDAAQAKADAAEKEVADLRGTESFTGSQVEALKTTIAELEQQLKTAQTEHADKLAVSVREAQENAKAEHKSAVEEVKAEHYAKVAALTTELEELKKEHQAKVAALTSDIESLIENGEGSAASHAKELEAHATEHAAKLAEAVAAANEAGDKMLADKIKSLEAEHAEAKQALAADHAKEVEESKVVWTKLVEELQSQLAASRSEHETVSKELADTASKHKAADKELEDLKVAHAKEAGALKVASEKEFEALRASHTKELESLQSAQAALAKELKDVRAAQATTAEDLEEALTSSATVAKDLEDLRTSQATAAKDLEESRALTASTTKELDEARVRLNDAETMNAQLLTKIENLDMQLAQTKRSPPASPSKRASSPTEIVQLRKELEARTDELEGMNLMLEMNRTEFERAMDQLRNDHAGALANVNDNLGSLHDQLKAERAEKTSALAKVRQLTAGADSSPRTAHIAQLEDTLAQLRAEVARRDVADAPNAPDDVEPEEEI